MLIRRTTIEDVAAIQRMYREVAKVPGGLARLDDEITDEYVNSFVAKSLSAGVSLVAVNRAQCSVKNNDGDVIGELHAYSSGLFCFSHVLTDLTVAVSPHFRNQGIARKLFKTFFELVQNEFPTIRRVELISRESNTMAIQFYESLGFVKEGRLENRIKNVDGSLEADIPMSWTKSTPHGGSGIGA
ncbi:MAG: GNAT family N-acetyltransferase [Deltaproteobacteria bacterium]|nr:GNAT family N-acetyltransferase [Deltaproteobacteria bacterium]